MPPRRLRTLIMGLALTILGPVLGFCIYLFLLLRAFPGATPTVTDAFAQLQELPTQLTVALLPMALGLLCGAAGFFMAISSLAIHFLGSESKTPALPRPSAQSNAAPKPASIEVPDDARYMPKYR